MKSLVVGFYTKGNLGDNYFIEAYRELFPGFDFTFTDCITEELLSSHDTIFFGGGSFLDGELAIPKPLVEGMKSKRIFYIGIGAETGIHPWHRYLIQEAELIAVRNAASLDKVRSLNQKVILCPDLVYALKDKVVMNDKRDNKRLLYLPNSHTASKWDSQAWKHTSWEQFKGEMAQVFEGLQKDKWKIDVLPMCENLEHKDHHAAAEVVNKMHDSAVRFLPFEEMSFSALTKTVSQYSLVISQRYHGLVVADMTRTPSVNIHHHDKLKNFYAPLNVNLDYYRAPKASIFQAIDDALALLSPDATALVINTDAFTDLKQKVKPKAVKEGIACLDT